MTEMHSRSIAPAAALNFGPRSRRQLRERVSGQVRLAWRHRTSIFAALRRALPKESAQSQLSAPVRFQFREPLLWNSQLGEAGSAKMDTTAQSESPGSQAQNLSSCAFTSLACQAVRNCASISKWLHVPSLLDLIGRQRATPTDNAAPGNRNRLIPQNSTPD